VVSLQNSGLLRLCSSPIHIFMEFNNSMIGVGFFLLNYKTKKQ